MDIPNIDIGQTYDTRYEGADIHIDYLHNLSNFFGRDMPAHRHDRFYQLHFLKTGRVTVQLGEQNFAGDAPLFYFTPPAVPHSFQLDDETSGLVLTVRREVVHRMISGADEAVLAQRFAVPVFKELKAVAQGLTREAQRLPRLLELLAEEFYERRPGSRHTLPALANLVLVSVFRLSRLPERTAPLGQVEMSIFQAFTTLIDSHYRDHWSLATYARALNVTQARLAEICRRLAGVAPKSLVYEKQVEEAKWQLIYATTAINVISDELGFRDPAYFSRFFTRHTGLSPREFRRQVLLGRGERLQGSAE